MDYPAENRESVTRLIKYRTEEIGYRDNFDLKNPAELLKVYTTVFAEDPDLYDLCRAAYSVPVREVSPTD